MSEKHFVLTPNIISLFNVYKNHDMPFEELADRRAELVQWKRFKAYVDGRVKRQERLVDETFTRMNKVVSPFTAQELNSIEQAKKETVSREALQQLGLI